jgi:hypothetical protein
MKTFTFKFDLRSDSGFHTISTVAASFEAAISMILNAENAPECAISDVESDMPKWHSIRKFEEIAVWDQGQNQQDNYIRHSLYVYKTFKGRNRKTDKAFRTYYMNDKQCSAVEFLKGIN